MAGLVVRNGRDRQGRNDRGGAGSLFVELGLGGLGLGGGGNLPRGGGGRFIAGPQEGLQAHITTLLQDGWGHGVAETPIGKCRYSAKQLIAWLKEAKERRAVVTLNPAIYQDGTFSQADVRLLREAHKAVKPGR